MNLKEYISSGVVESYVLGLASSEERAEFERMCMEHPEVRQARDGFEQVLENQVKVGRLEPPSNLKSKIFAEIEIERDKGPQKLARTRSLQPPVIRAGWARYLAAASILLLVASTFLNFYFLGQYKKYFAKYDQLQALQQQTATANQALQASLDEYTRAMDHLKDPRMAIVKLPGLSSSPSPNSMATVYWDTLSKDVYLLVNHLAKVASDKQYQLWAMVNGKPVDAGIFEVNEGLAFVKLKNIPQAEAFAITLERKGGSLTPTMDAMCAMGKVAS